MRSSSRYLRIVRRWHALTIIPSLMMFLAACDTGMVEPAATLLESRSQTPLLGQSTAPGATSPFACFTSISVTGKPYSYEYNRIPLDFENGVIVAAKGFTMTYRHRVIDTEGKILRLANCKIPRAMAAIQAMNQRFQVPPHLAAPKGRTASGDEVSTQGCVSDGHCEIDGIVVVGTRPQSSQPQEECNYLGCPGYTTGGPGPGEGSDGTGNSGGSTPCTTCDASAPVMTCPSSVVRGSPVTCTVAFGSGDNSMDWSVNSWQFTSGGTISVTSGGGSTSWSGTTVVGGTVYATVVKTDGTSNQLISSFAVTSRGWRWGASNWTYSPGMAPVCYNQELGPGVHIGWNTNVGTCTPSEGRYLPNMLTSPRAGYSVAQVTGGPNTGLWYVTAASYYMQRVSNLNPQVTQSGSSRQLPEGPQAAECRSQMGLAPGTPVVVNFYEYNLLCKGVNMSALIQGAWDHEGFGTAGTNGHEGRAHSLVSQLANDPYAIIEDAFNFDEASLRNAVEGAVWHRNVFVSNESGKHTHVTNNWTGSFWIWDPSTSQYVQITQTF